MTQEQSDKTGDERMSIEELNARLRSLAIIDPKKLGTTEHSAWRTACIQAAEIVWASRSIVPESGERERLLYTCRRNAQEWRDKGDDISIEEARQWDEIGDFIESNAIARSGSGECGVDDVVAWADGVVSAFGTEHGRKVTPMEARVAAAIIKAYPASAETVSASPLRDYQALAEQAIERIADHHDETTEALLVIDVRKAIEKAVRESRSTRPFIAARLLWLA